MAIAHSWTRHRWQAGPFWSDDMPRAHSWYGTCTCGKKITAPTGWELETARQAHISQQDS